jgi:hypothetical protein
VLLLFFSCSLDPHLFGRANKFTGSSALIGLAR